MEILITILVGVFLIEVYAWLPKWIERLLEQTILQLPAGERDRCREEWKANLDALPNSGVRLVHAISFRLAADRINANIFDAKLEEFADSLRILSNEHSSNALKMRVVRLRAAENRRTIEDFEHRVDKPVALVRAIEEVSVKVARKGT